MLLQTFLHDITDPIYHNVPFLYWYIVLVFSRYKVESQLVALLQKYDSDIGERQALLEEITANYEEEKKQMAVLQVVLMWH